MKNITYKDYITEIKAQYEVEKKGIYASYLSKPSPALLNDFCKILKQKGLSQKDSMILETFYNLPNFDVDKFRPICNFFKGKTSAPNQDILDVMALLVNLQPRPLGDFLKSKHNPPKNHAIDKTGSSVVLSNKPMDLLPKKMISSSRNRLLILICLFLCLSIIVYWNFKRENSCLEWQNNRYIEVACNKEINGFAELNTKVPYNERLLLLRRIIPNDTITYFKNDKAVIWYCKMDEDHIELFNQPGHHPVTNKPLKAITEYIIERYLK
ncbi:hypothetical protein [Flavobacterium columnare]|uniref:hypothetical protein n=1 Tax=Flavobacterium columnare TaxID=996 RepID=UPI0040338EA9